MLLSKTLPAHQVFLALAMATAYGAIFHYSRHREHPHRQAIAQVLATLEGSAQKKSLLVNEISEDT